MNDVNKASTYSLSGTGSGGGEEGKREGDRGMGIATRYTRDSGGEEIYQQDGWWFCFAK